MKRFFKAISIFIPLIAAGLMYLLLPHFPYFTEYVFSRGIFKLITVPLGFVTSLLPFSLTELLVVLALPAVIFLAVLLAKKLKKSSDKKKTLLKASRAAACFVSFACLMYMICHGANYYRLPMEQLMELDTSPKTAEHLLNVCIELAENAKAIREELPQDNNGNIVFEKNVFSELTRTNAGYDKLATEYPFLWSASLRQKPVMLSEPWSYTGIVGMYFPFLAECNVNIAQPDFLIPFTAAHESAHLRGIAFENECNFLAFLSCISSPYAEYRYSGYMEAYIYCSNALYSYNKDMWRKAYSHCSEGMLRDFSANSEYIDSHTVTVTEIASAANDTFIKSQGVADGSLSYGRAAELILAYYEKLWENN